MSACSTNILTIATASFLARESCSLLITAQLLQLMGAATNSSNIATSHSEGKFYSSILKLLTIRLIIHHRCDSFLISDPISTSPLGHTTTLECFNDFRSLTVQLLHKHGDNVSYLRMYKALKLGLLQHTNCLLDSTLNVMH